MVGFGLLTDRVLALVTGRVATASFDGTPSWLWWLSLQWFEANKPVQLVVIAGVVTVIAGAAAGLLSRRRTWPGIAVLAVLGLVGMGEIWSTDTGNLNLAVPAVATLAGMISFGALLSVGRSHGGPEVDGPDAGERWLTPRRAVLGGALLALGTGAAGALVGGPLASAQPRRFVPPAGGEPLLRGSVVNVRDLGALGDGRTDDAPAIRRALETVNQSGGTLHFPAGIYRYRSADALRLAAGVTLSGVPGESVIDFAQADPNGFLLCCAVDADDVTIDGVIIRRAGAFDSVLLATGAFQRFTLSRSVLVGNMDIYPDTYCHGIKFSDSDVSGGLHIVDSMITTTQYGLFQTNQSTATTTDIVVERCLFTRNQSTDLEFNSPSGTTRQVTVRDCTFSDNDSPGFGVGLANVQDAVIRNNTFTNYALEAVHVEDYSTRVTVEANEFTACGIRLHSYVQILSGAMGVDVVGNTFHATMNANEIYAVTSQPGGVGLTGGGRPVIAPSDVSLRNNLFECSAAVTPAYFQESPGGSIVGNTIVGPGVSGPDDAFDLPASDATIVRDNEINGRRY